MGTRDGAPRPNDAAGDAERPGTTDAEPAVVTSAVTGPGGSEPVFTIGASVPQQSRGALPVHNVWSVGELVDSGARIEDVLSAIEVAQQTIGSAATVKYHSATRLVIANSNVPNMVGQISTRLAAAGVNIADLLNKSRGNCAYTVIDADGSIDAATFAAVRGIEGVLSARLIAG